MAASVSIDKDSGVGIAKSGQQHVDANEPLRASPVIYIVVGRLYVLMAGPANLAFALSN